MVKSIIGIAKRLRLEFGANQTGNRLRRPVWKLQFKVLTWKLWNPVSMTIPIVIVVPATGAPLKWTEPWVGSDWEVIGFGLNPPVANLLAGPKVKGASVKTSKSRSLAPAGVLAMLATIAQAPHSLATGSLR
jgi:hypothetical protein